MAFLKNNKFSEEYVLPTGKFEAGEYTQESIMVFNNQNIKFTFSGTDIIPSNLNLTNKDSVKKYKAIIDFDDETPVIEKSKPIKPIINTIEDYSIEQWYEVNHHFSLNDNDDDFKNIKFTIYNIIGDALIFNIPYKIVYENIYGIGSEFDVESSSITSSNKTSNVLYHKKDDVLIVVNFS